MFTIKHYFREGLITLSLEYFKINHEDALLYNYNHVEQLEMMITRALDAGKGSSLPAIQRCLPRWASVYSLPHYPIVGLPISQSFLFSKHVI